MVIFNCLVSCIILAILYSVHDTVILDIILIWIDNILASVALSVCSGSCVCVISLWQDVQTNLQHGWPQLSCKCNNCAEGICCIFHPWCKMKNSYSNMQTGTGHFPAEARWHCWWQEHLGSAHSYAAATITWSRISIGKWMDNLDYV